MNYYYKVLINRINSIKKGILAALIISLFIICVIEFWLIKIPASSNFYFILGKIFLKMSYSYFSAFIFYFIVIHLPKEKRKVKLYRQINNKILTINHNLKEVIISILDAGNYDYKNDKLNFSLTKLSNKDFKEACRKIDPLKKLNLNAYYPPFKDWYEFLTFKGKEIKNLINDILLINDNLDSEVLELLTFIDDETSKFIYERKKYGNKDLENIGISIYETTLEMNRLVLVFKEKYDKYNYEYHYNYRLRNRKAYP